MSKKNIFGFIVGNGRTLSYRFRKGCTAIVFCFLPFIYEPSFAFSSQTSSECFRSKINITSEISHSAEISVIERPIFLWSLEKRQSLINFSSELAGSSGTYFALLMLSGDNTGQQSTDQDRKNDEEQFFDGLYWFISFGCSVWVIAMILYLSSTRG